MGNSHYGNRDQTRWAPPRHFSFPFQPGDSVVREYQDSNRVTFRLLKPAEVPVVKSLRKKGYTILKAPAVSRAAVAEALRAERDAR